MQKGRPVGILFADADHLKYINDNFGHDMGNLAIRSIASVIQQQCPVGSISMRYGGDEFVCVIPDYSQSKIQQLKESILASLEEFSSTSRTVFPLEASIGFVVADDPVFSLNDYINLADEKMYAEKKRAQSNPPITYRSFYYDTIYHQSPRTTDCKYGQRSLRPEC